MHASRKYLLGILAVLDAVKCQTASSSQICDELSDDFPGQIYKPGSPEYETETQGKLFTGPIYKLVLTTPLAFFSATAWLKPLCVFAPKDAQCLADGVRKLATSNTKFAVRSGGHMPIKGFASTDNGVMIATTNLNEKTLVPTPNNLGATYLRAGAAFRWQELYEFVNPDGLIVVGGRVASVGSSLAIGGGLSYHSYEHGWAANNVLNFELVTGNGTILQVNQHSYPDLYWALKGGSNNFGIMTSYSLRTYPSGTVWGGAVAYAPNTTQQYIDAFGAYLSPGGGVEDRKGNMMPSYSYSPSTGAITSGNVYFYDAAVNNPEAFENFTAIHTTTNGAGLMNFSQITAQTERPASKPTRWSWYDTALKFDKRSIQLVHDALIANADSKIGHVANITVAFAGQALSVSMLQAARRSGGDAIDLDPAQGGVLVAEIVAFWTNPDDDATVKDFLTSTIADIDARSKAIHIYSPFTWLNDAGGIQNPFATYGGGKSLPKLRAISRKYDPAGVFQKLVPGFKLW